MKTTNAFTLILPALLLAPLAAIAARPNILVILADYTPLG